jgi:hypothetical protein
MFKSSSRPRPSAASARSSPALPLARRPRRGCGPRACAPGGEQRLTPCPQHPGGTVKIGAEPAQQCRLADPGLTRHQHDPALPAGSRRRQVLAQDLEMLRSLQQPGTADARSFPLPSPPLIWRTLEARPPLGACPGPRRNTRTGGTSSQRPEINRHHIR